MDQHTEIEAEERLRLCRAAAIVSKGTIRYPHSAKQGTLPSYFQPTGNSGSKSDSESSSDSSSEESSSFQDEVL